MPNQPFPSHRWRTWPRLTLGGLLLLIAALLFVGSAGATRLASAVLALDSQVTIEEINASAPPFASERVRIAFNGVDTPSDGRQINGYLLDVALQSGALCGDLAVTGDEGSGAISTTRDFPGWNLVERYDAFRLVQEMTVFEAVLPAGVRAPLRAILARADDTPSNKGYGVGLQQQAVKLSDHAGFALDAANRGDMASARRHTEHVLNILYGAADPRYGDQDNDGAATNPGDGYGLLVYGRQTASSLQSAAGSGDATENVQTRAAEAQIALNNIGSGDDGEWAALLIERANTLLATTESGEITAIAQQMVGLANRIDAGEDLNDSGEVEPLVDEGGAQVAYRYTQYAADLVGSAGYVRFSDSDSGSSKSSDGLNLSLSGLAPPATNERYYAYLVRESGERTLVGAVDSATGDLAATVTGSGENLTADHGSVVVTVGRLLAEDVLPETALGYLRSVLGAANGTPGNVGYGIGLATESKLLVDHAGLARNAANAGDLAAAHTHAEHVLNLLYGSTDPRFGDFDGNGLPDTPGDGFGILPYRAAMSQALAQANEASDATQSIQQRAAEAQIALENIGSGDDGAWANLLIDAANKLLATNDTGQAQTLANQMVARASEIYLGTELNDNGEIEPIAGEGGALSAYGTAQRAIEYQPQPIDALLPTPTPTASATATVPADATATPPPTPVPTRDPAIPPPTASGVGDRYENDDQCANARRITTDGLLQSHSFHSGSDADWVRFDATSGDQYVIEVTIPSGSPADVAAELYLACDAAATEAQDFQFAPGVRIDYTADQTAPAYLRLFSSQSQGGDDVRYNLSVRSLQNTDVAPGLLIIIAGQIKNNDPVQPNIYHVTDEVRQLFLDKGATDDQIYYIAPDLSRAGVDVSATEANVEAAITQWADEQAATAQSLTIYMMDHGNNDLFYLDKRRGEWLTPSQLNGWLETLETLRPTLNINIIYEACESGSFISGDESISKPGRVVMASTDDVNLAWASDDGAIFSDHLLDGLRGGESLYTSFENARIAAQIAHPQQQPWIDADGDGNGTDDASQTVAAQRGFAFAGTFPDEIWPPFIAEMQAIVPDDQGRAVIRAQVRDDVAVDNVWAVIYPPSYQAPTEGEELVQEALPTTVLLDQGNDWYGARYDGFREPGTYRIVIYADDNEDVDARPVSVSVTIAGGNLYLPLVAKP